MSMRDWLPRPRRVVTLFLAVAVVSTGALGWLTWRLLEQDVELDVARRRGQLEQAADVMASALVNALDDLEALGIDEPAAMNEVPPDVTVATLAPGGTLVRSGVLPFVPTRAVLPEAPEGMLAAANRAAELDDDAATARRLYGTLAAKPELPLRAKALTRLAALEKREGNSSAALRAYTELERIDDAGVGGLPASLIAQIGRASVLERANQTDELRDRARVLLTDLYSGRWPLLASEFEYYRAEAVRWLGRDTGTEADHDAMNRADAADWLWRNAASLPPDGRQLVSLRSGPALVFWRRRDSNVAAVLCGTARLHALIRTHMPDGFEAAAIDALGSFVSGNPASTGQATTRPAGVNGLPFTLQVSGAAAGSSPQRPLLALVLGATIVLVGSGWYFILRAIAREARAARLQSEFVAAVSHEFRSPLTSISHVAELLAEDRLPTNELRRQSYLALVRDADRLRRLVENLLDFGRFDTGAATYRFERTDVTALVGAVVEDFRERVTPAGWQIDLASPSGIVSADIDREAFSRALWNLLDNAVKYSPDTRQVWVGVEPSEQTVNIRVRDRGIGIPAGELHSVFERFVRGSTPKGHGIAGTGIGLAMVRQIARAHGGDVTVTSEPGVGSEFTLVLKQAEGTA